MDTEGLSIIAMWAIVIGFVQPPVLALIIQTKWSTRAQSIAAFAFSILTGGISAILNGQLNGTSIVASVLIVAVTSISTYQGFWKPSGTAPAIEKATSKGNG